MKKMIRCFLFIFLIHNLSIGFCQQACTPQERFDGDKLLLSKAEWKKKLTPLQFRVLREGETEPPFQNPYFDNKRKGIYRCAGCHLALFSSSAKYDSKTGWPSFWEPICPENVTLRKTWNPFSSTREAICSRCEGHLGDCFKDGPPPTGDRYCVNSAALQFIPAKVKSSGNQSSSPK